MKKCPNCITGLLFKDHFGDDTCFTCGMMPFRKKSLPGEESPPPPLRGYNPASTNPDKPVQVIRELDVPLKVMPRERKLTPVEGALFADKRRAMGYQQYQLATKLGCRTSTITGIENGSVQLTTKLAIRYFRFLDNNRMGALHKHHPPSVNGLDPFPLLDEFIVPDERIYRFHITCIRETSRTSEIADYLFNKGLTYREAHEITDRFTAFVVEAQSNGRTFADPSRLRYSKTGISLKECRQFSPLIDKKIYSLQIRTAKPVTIRNIPIGLKWVTPRGEGWKYWFEDRTASDVAEAFNRTFQETYYREILMHTREFMEDEMVKLYGRKKHEYNFSLPNS